MAMISNYRKLTKLVMHINTPFNLMADGGAVNLGRYLQESRAADFKSQDHCCSSRQHNNKRIVRH